VGAEGGGVSVRLTGCGCRQSEDRRPKSALGRSAARGYSKCGDVTRPASGNLNQKIGRNEDEGGHKDRHSDHVPLPPGTATLCADAVLRALGDHAVVLGHTVIANVGLGEGKRLEPACAVLGDQFLALAARDMRRPTRKRVASRVRNPPSGPKPAASLAAWLRPNYCPNEGMLAAMCGRSTTALSIARGAAE